MKKITLLFFISFLVKFTFAQFNLGSSYNFDVYKPYTPEAQEYIKINDKVYSSTYNFFLSKKLIDKPIFSWSSGFTYKNIDHIVKEKIKIYYTYQYENDYTWTYKHDDPLDLKSQSHSFALMNEFSYHLNKNEKTTNEIGLINELYFLEFFKSAYYYSHTDKIFDELSVSIMPLSSELVNPFLLSCINLSSFYRFTYKASDKFSLATKISLGTNLYSDWDQFKKYAWLGVGLELGFGKKPLLKKKEQ